MKGIGLRLALPAVALALVVPAASRAEDTSAHSRDVEAKIAYCKKCHGQSGQGIAAAYPVPRLAGQTIPYLEAKFGIISDHRRDNLTAETFMVPVLGSVDPAIRRAVAAHFNALEPPPSGGGKKDLIPEGKKIFESGIPEAKVPACASCHGDTGRGSDSVPRVAGQVYNYTNKVLSNWSIINREQDSVKSPVEHKLSDEQIEAVASYLANLK
jgi:cytochrome c553